MFRHLPDYPKRKEHIDGEYKAGQRDAYIPYRDIPYAPTKAQHRDNVAYVIRYQRLSAAAHKEAMEFVSFSRATPAHLMLQIEQQEMQRAASQLARTRLFMMLGDQDIRPDRHATQ